MLEQSIPINRDRLSVLVATILLLIVLFRFVELPESVWRLDVLGSPLEVRLTNASLLIALTVGLVITGTRYVLRGHPDVPDRLSRPLYLSWVLPALLSGLVVAVLQRAPTIQLWAGGVLLTGLLISLAVSAEFTALSTEDARYTRARLTLNLLAYLLAFALFYLIYQTRMRSIITATAITVAAFLVALDLMSVADVGVERVALYAGSVGLIVGETTWALNYWQLGNWAGAFVILLVFYVTSGMAHQHLLERLSARVLVEFALVTIMALIILFVAL